MSFRIDSDVKHECIMSPLLFNVYIDAVMKKVKIAIGRMWATFLEEGRDWRFPGLLYADDFVLCDESEER